MPVTSRWRAAVLSSGLVLLAGVAVVLVLAWAGRRPDLQEWIFGRPLEHPRQFWPSWGLPTDVCEELPPRAPYVIPIGGSSTESAFADVPDELRDRVSRTAMISISFENQVPLVRLICDRWDLATRARGSVMVFGFGLLPTSTTDASYLDHHRRVIHQRFEEDGLYLHGRDGVLRPLVPSRVRPLWIETYLRGRRFAQLARRRWVYGPQPFPNHVAALPAAGRAVAPPAPPSSNLYVSIIGPDTHPLPSELDALRACIALAHRAGAQPVLLHLPMPRALREFAASLHAGEACERLAGETGATYWDYADLLPDSGFVDGMGHHNAEGQRVIAEVIHTRLAGLLPAAPTP